MNYKVGDKVRVREDLEVSKRYGAQIFISKMEKCKGKILEITEILGNDGFAVKESIYMFTPDMIRPAEFKIWCETTEENQVVREELEKEGYVWCNGGEKPTGAIDKNPKCGLFIRNSSLSYDYDKEYFDRNYRMEFTPSEFTGIDFPRKIIITETDTGAIATYEDKTVTVEEEFEYASKQALAEILCPFKVGDKVCVKDDKEIAYSVERIRAKTEVTLSKNNRYSGETWLVEQLEIYTEQLYNAKLFCIEGDERTFKQGHIYEVKDGIFHGNKDNKFHCLEEINNLYCSKFMEVKDD